MKLSRMLAALLATCACAGAYAQVVDGQVTALQQDGSWSSFVIGHGADNRFRAATVTSGASMMLDVLPPKCAVFVEFNLPFSQPSTVDIPPIDVALNLRIDSGDVHSMRGFTNPVAMGDKTYIVYLRALSDFEDLHRDLKNGAVLRIKETISGVDDYYTFALNGFDSAFQRAYQGCLSYISTTTPPSNPAPKPKPPGGNSFL